MKQRKPGSLLTFSYFMGMLTVLFLTMAVQALIGKEQYISYLQEHWVQGFTGLWLILLICAAFSTLAHIRIKVKLNAVSDQLKEDE